MNIVGPPLGKLGLVTERLGTINVNQAIALFRPTSDLLPEYLLAWLIGAPSKSWLRQRAKQTSGQLNLTLGLCQQVPLPRIRIDEQQRIVDRLRILQETMLREAAKLDNWRHVKIGLMDDLLTGRVRVTPLLKD